MSTSDSSTKPTAGSADLSAALAALTAELADRPAGDYDHIHPILSHLTIGHLRQIAAALAAPYVPGMVEIDSLADHEEVSEHALLTMWLAPDFRVEHHSFAAVQS